MKNKKKALARVIHALGVIKLCRPMIPGRLVVFNYHRIREDKPGRPHPFDDDVFGPTAAEFIRQMKWLKRNVNVISESDLIGHLRSGNSLRGLNVLITFDDGYIDNYTLAYPVLKELRIPAIFFIASAMVRDRTLGWWDIAAYLIKSADRREICWRGTVLDLTYDRTGAIRYFQALLQKMRPAGMRDLMEELAEYCRVPFPDADEQDAQIMNWDQIRTVYRDGITIGSHTHSHPTMSTLSAREQKEEMLISATMLKEKIGAAVRSVAYPLGGRAHISEDTVRAAAEAGYEAGFSFNTGYNILTRMDRYDLKRISGPDDFYLLASAVAFTGLFARK